MTDDPQMARAVPDLRLRGDPPRVMRLSRKALAVIGIAASAGIAGSLLYGLRQPQHTKPQQLYNTEGAVAAQGVASAPKDYADVPRLGPPLPGDLGRPILSAQQRGEELHAPPMGGGTVPTPPAANSAQNAAEAARQRIRQERDAARTSKLFGTSGVTEQEAPASGPPSSLPLAASAMGSPSSGSQSEIARQGDQASKRAFLAAGTARSASQERLQSPASPYVLQAGSIIPAALITGIRSDLPGQITAQVTENVYDSPTGRLLLIPQGARLIGEYDAQISFGQNRVLLAWDRLILPDGRAITLERQPGTDAAGFAGLQDRTNYHWGSMAKATLLSTLLAIGGLVGTDDGGALARALRDGLSDSVNQTGQQIVRRQLNVPPTLTIRPGFPVRVLVTRDIVLAPLLASSQ